MTLILVSSPLTKSYEEFFKKVFLVISPKSKGVDVLVTSKVSRTGELNFILLQLYTQLRNVATEAGHSYHFQINVLVNRSIQDSYDEVFMVTGEDNFDFLDATAISVESPAIEPHFSTEDSFPLGGCSISAVGGTFDHIHDGHKILLLMAALVARKRVIVGVTGPALLVKKKYAEYLQSLQHRVESVYQFLRKVSLPDTDFQIYQINDVCGPTGYVSGIEALIISEETASGAKFVNNYRSEVGFSQLEIISAQVIGGDGSGNASNNWKNKLSSTDMREIEWKANSDA